MKNECAKLSLNEKMESVTDFRTNIPTTQTVSPIDCALLLLYLGD